MRLGQPIIGIHEFAVVAHQCGQDRFGFTEFTLHEQRFGQAEPRPGYRFHVKQLLVNRLGFGRLSENHVQFRPQAHEVGGEARIFYFSRGALVDRFQQIALFHQLIDGHEQRALLDRAPEPLEQRIGGKRLQQIIGRRQFGRADHFLISAFGRDHHENGP